MGNVGINNRFCFIEYDLLFNSIKPSFCNFLTTIFSQSIFSGGSTSAHLSGSTASCWGNGSVCQKIAKIWRDFCDCITSCFSKIYRYIESFFITPYPEINQNMSRDALLKLYWGLGRENKWMECIEGRYHHLGRNTFDAGLHAGTVEPGFIGSMEGAFRFVEQAINRKIDANWYLNLHKHTCAHFNGDPSAFLMGQEKVGVFRNSDDPIYCTLADHYGVSAEAKAEFEALNREIATEFGPEYGLGEMTYTQSFSHTVRLNYKVMNRHQILRIFNKFLTDFYREVESAGVPDAKLMAIAKLQQRLEWLHPVKDGTARTSTALMNKFLTDYGFHPAILDYPHVSSSYTLRRWKEYLQAGLVKWESLSSRFNQRNAI